MRHLSAQSGFLRIRPDGVLVAYNDRLGRLYLLYLSDRIYLPPSSRFGNCTVLHSALFRSHDGALFGEDSLEIHSDVQRQWRRKTLSNSERRGGWHVQHAHVTGVSVALLVQALSSRLARRTHIPLGGLSSLLINVPAKEDLNYILISSLYESWTGPKGVGRDVER